MKKKQFAATVADLITKLSGVVQDNPDAKNWQWAGSDDGSLGIGSDLDKHSDVNIFPEQE